MWITFLQTESSMLTHHAPLGYSQVLYLLPLPLGQVSFSLFPLSFHLCQFYSFSRHNSRATAYGNPPLQWFSSDHVSDLCPQFITLWHSIFFSKESMYLFMSYILKTLWSLMGQGLYMLLLWCHAKTPSLTLEKCCYIQGELTDFSNNNYQFICNAYVLWLLK